MSNGREGCARRALAAVAMLAATVVAARADDGVPLGYVETMAWYESRAGAGDAQAQFLLGYARETGTQQGYVPEEERGRVVDHAQARNWYAAAASQGHGRAQLRLALMLLEGRGGPPDGPAARRFLARAAAAGVVDAMSLLGFLLIAEEPFDPPTAFRWLSLAAEAGDEVAARNLATLAGEMSGDALDSAAAALEAWRAAMNP